MAGQLALDERWTSVVRPQTSGRLPQEPVLCAGCRAREARYGFRDEATDEAPAERPRTLCFECFRAEIGRRQAVAARLAHGWNATQVGLPLAKTLEDLGRRRRRAQIAARRALAEVEKLRSGEVEK
jgi:hypothetical protein